MNAENESTQTDLVVFAHELRQPLASILLAAQCLHEVVDPAFGSREMCQLVERQTRFLVRMIEEVLEQGQRKVGVLRLRRDWFDLRAVIAGAIEATGGLLKLRSSRLTVSLPSEQLWINADPLRVQQILINLLTNAAKYTQHGGRVQLVAGVAADVIVIEVNDDGMGIPETLLPRVFDLFERDTGAAHSEIAGFGIGLALVKSLVELHGGSVRAHSDGVGTGSTFVVQLPVTGGSVPKNSDHQPHAPGRQRVERHPGINAMTDA